MSGSPEKDELTLRQFEAEYLQTPDPNDLTGIYCPVCEYRHNDPRLADPEADIPIDLAGAIRLCPVYARWVAQRILAGHTVTIRRIGAEDRPLQLDGWKDPA